MSICNTYYSDQNSEIRSVDGPVLATLVLVANTQKPILNTHSVVYRGVRVSSLVFVFIYMFIHFMFIRAAKALASRICAGSPNTSSLENAISIKISCAGLS